MDSASESCRMLALRSRRSCLAWASMASRAGLSRCVDSGVWVWLLGRRFGGWGWVVWRGGGEVER